MRKQLGVMLGISLLWAMPQAFADVSAQSQISDAGQGFTTVACSGASCPNVSGFGKGTFIKGFKLLSGAANSGCAIYDAIALQSRTTTNPTPNLVDELLEATAGESNLHMFPYPIQLQTGLTIEVLGAGTTCIVYK